MGRTTDEKGTDKAQAIRRSQQKDRSRILQEIQQSQTTLARYSENVRLYLMSLRNRSWMLANQIYCRLTLRSGG
jgi:uncharacterized protein YlxW (UPF0749 family)